jgi:hypothetical protein
MTPIIAYATEGRNSSVAVAIQSGGVVEIGVNGHVEASTQPYDMRLQRMPQGRIGHSGPLRAGILRT